MTFKPLPTKMRESFDIPALIELIQKEGEFKADCRFEDLLVVRNYITRHDMPLMLSQCRVPQGFVLKLKGR